MNAGDRTPVPTGEAAEPTRENAYYEAISERYGIAQVFLYLSLFTFVVFFLILHSDRITYQNFYYFFRDLGTTAGSTEILRSESVSYPADRERGFTLYRQGLAVAGSSTVTLFSPSGKQLISERASLRSPAAVGTGKYLLVYETGGTRYSLYNSFSCIFSGTADAPIRGADVSPTGSFAVISSSPEYDSVVELYDGDLRLTSRFLINGYVTDVSLHPKGTMVAMLISTAGDGTFRTVLRICHAENGKTVSETVVGEGLGLRCAFTSSGIVSVLTSSGAAFLNARGRLISEVPFSGETVFCADLNTSGTALILKESARSQKIHILMFDKSGKMLYNDFADGGAEAVSITSGAAFVQQSGSILRVRKGTVERMSIAAAGCTLLAVDRDDFYLCTAKQAVCLRFSPE